MFLSRAKSMKAAASAVETKTNTERKESKMPKLENFISNRDFTGATTLLEFQRNGGDNKTLTRLWLAYAYFHFGDFQKALDVYRSLLDEPNPDSFCHLYAACCLFHLGLYREAKEEAEKGPGTRLQNRVLFHVSHKLNNETDLMKYHQKLTDIVEDQLSLASIHYLRSHFQNSIDIYKNLLKNSRDGEYVALQVYVAMCYYKLDYYDVSLQILNPYLDKYPDSVMGTNLKACNCYKLYDGKAAEAELKGLSDLMASSTQNFDNDLIRHNLVVFRDGENALQVLPPLLDVVPEARLNLVIFNLRNDDIHQAYELIKDLEPTTPQEYILKGVASAAYGQANDSVEHLKLAQQLFQLVGTSTSECDTIPGRQCMASFFLLIKQYDDVLIYLKSIQPYFQNDLSFNYNFGMALAASGRYQEAVQPLMAVVSLSNGKLPHDFAFLAALARCYIMLGNAREAWELYLKMDTSSDSFQLLALIANDCYKVGSFYYAAKAFDVLERLDPNPEYWDGKRGACCGVFQAVIANRMKKEQLRDIIMMLRTNQPQADFISRVMRRWAEEHGLKIN